MPGATQRRAIYRLRWAAKGSERYCSGRTAAGWTGKAPSIDAKSEINESSIWKNLDLEVAARRKWHRRHGRGRARNGEGGCMECQLRVARHRHDLRGPS
jgi:hypothetical protein